MRLPLVMPMGARRRALLAAMVASVAGCQLAPAASSSPPPPADLLRRRFLLLGEAHDNALHHTQRAEWLSRLLAQRRAAGGSTWVIFEQMESARNAALQQACQRSPLDATAVALAGGLDLAAWGWPLHQPLFDAALAGGAQLAGGDVSRERARQVVREGRPAVPAELLPLLDAPGWRSQDQQSLERDIEASHCGALPTRLFAPMALAQRVRDAAMAQAMLQAAATAPDTQVVLIAGNGHVRRDLGVPFYLQAAGVASAQIAAIAWLEGPPDQAPSEAAEEAAHYDGVQRTAAAQRPDPCEGMRPPKPG